MDLKNLKSVWICMDLQNLPLTAGFKKKIFLYELQEFLRTFAVATLCSWKLWFFHIVPWQLAIWAGSFVAPCFLVFVFHLLFKLYALAFQELSGQVPIISDWFYYDSGSKIDQLSGGLCGTKQARPFWPLWPWHSQAFLVVTCKEWRQFLTVAYEIQQAWLEIQQARVKRVRMSPLSNLPKPITQILLKVQVVGENCGHSQR